LGNCDLKVIGKTAFNAEFLTIANTLRGDAFANANEVLEFAKFGCW
jgi:cell division protein FtsX